MKIYLATWLFETAQGEALTKVNKRSRLLSYYHTRQKIESFIPYIKTGK